jgi:hypothetical protein
MIGLLFLFLASIFSLWLICYLFFRLFLWVVEPLIEYFEDREIEQSSIEDIDQGEFDDKQDI